MRENEARAAAPLRGDSRPALSVLPPQRRVGSDPTTLDVRLLPPSWLALPGPAQLQPRVVSRGLGRQPLQPPGVRSSRGPCSDPVTLCHCLHSSRHSRKCLISLSLWLSRLPSLPGPWPPCPLLFPPLEQTWDADSLSWCTPTGSPIVQWGLVPSLPSGRLRPCNACRNSNNQGP